MDQRIELGRTDEFLYLAISINDMSDQIQKMLESKKQVLLAISHELRSPITRAKVASEMLFDSTYKESIVEDLNEVEQLVQEILESERLNTKHAPLFLSKVNLKE